MYLFDVLSSLLVPLFVTMVIIVVGFLIGGIEIKGISLGTAGVLLAAIVVGVIFSFIDSVEIAGETINLWTTAKDLDKLIDLEKQSMSPSKTACRKCCSFTYSTTQELR